MVATDAQVEEVIERSGLLDSLEHGGVICIASSCSPETCRRLAKIAAARRVGVLDCPVVLGQEAANNGAVTAYVGGDEQSFRRARPRQPSAPEAAPGCVWSAPGLRSSR